MNVLLIGLGIAGAAGIATLAAILAARWLSRILAIVVTLAMPLLTAWLVFDASVDFLLPKLVAEPGPPSADDGPLIFAGALMLAAQAALAAFVGAITGACMVWLWPKKRREVVMD